MIIIEMSFVARWYWSSYTCVLNAHQYQHSTQTSASTHMICISIHTHCLSSTECKSENDLRPSNATIEAKNSIYSINALALWLLLHFHTTCHSLQCFCLLFSKRSKYEKYVPINGSVEWIFQLRNICKTFFHPFVLKVSVWKKNAVECEWGSAWNSKLWISPHWCAIFFKWKGR